MATSASSARKSKKKVADVKKVKKLGWSARSMLWTLNNYSEEEVEALKEYGATACRYMVFSYEIAPTTGTPHLQGYTAFDNTKSADTFKQAISQKLSLRRANGTANQNRNYVLKDETKDPNKNPFYFEIGECPRQGERTDWGVALEEIISGASVEEVIVKQPQLLPCIRAIDSFKSRMLKPKHRNVNVIVLWGDSGTGKSRWAYDNFPDLYPKQPNKWWDGYTGQTTILLDDFYGYIPYSDMLNVLDRYPYHAEVKNGHVWAQWDTVIITSNKPPDAWYYHGLTPALKRRINKIFFYSIDAPPIQTYPSSAETQESPPSWNEETS